ncbi:LysR family transcriptional regulator [Acetobacterium wieringae]|uniref:HTH-type transcriptional regulator GltR n=1 Tax=Acetobacterium wieringae TaxID=52694 RepID=A0A1F2PK71_9FIRM|nr:LysR family transcriptional regulator [Acetobacterium wieringae]MEA4805768.1 LysR family transcriptional regulator [Acetobacterium wieringae]OFV71131.1 HTH-type transcriptional regulator GltR [Acetobacterium wieringae]
MDTQHLKTFIQLSSTKNFTQTAKLLFVAQSTVTNRIAELEKSLGKPLLIRDKKQVVLTPEGQLFLGYAKRLLELEESAIEQINASNFSRKVLRFGTTNSIYENYLYPLIRSVLTNDLNMSTKIIINHSFEILSFLQDGLIDIAFTYIPFTKNGYICTPFKEDELILVTAKSNADFAGGIVQKDLIALDYLFCNFALQKVGLFIRELFPPHHQFKFEIDNSSKLIPFLLDGIGYSFLPKSLISHYLENHSLISIPLLDFNTPTIKSYYTYKEDDAVVLSKIIPLIKA